MADAEGNPDNQKDLMEGVIDPIKEEEGEEAIEALEEGQQQEQQEPEQQDPIPPGAQPPEPPRQMNNLELINAVIAPVPNLSPREQIHFLNEIFRYDDDDTSDNTIECDCSDCESERRAIERATISLDSDEECDCTSCLSNCRCVSCAAEDRHNTGNSAPKCLKLLKLKSIQEVSSQHAEPALVLQLPQPKPSTSAAAAAVEVQN